MSLALFITSGFPGMRLALEIGSDSYRKRQWDGLMFSAGYFVRPHHHPRAYPAPMSEISLLGSNAPELQGLIQCAAVTLPTSSKESF